MKECVESFKFTLLNEEYCQKIEIIYFSAQYKI